MMVEMQALPQGMSVLNSVPNVMPMNPNDMSHLSIFNDTVNDATVRMDHTGSINHT